MATKNTGVPCYDKAGGDEPIFVLRAQDKLAPEIVLQWADQAARSGASPDKIREAIKLADEMIEWQGKNNCKIPD